MITFLETKPNREAHLQLLQISHPKWSELRMEAALSAFGNSQYCVSAYDEEILVGTVRLITDSIGFGLIADLLVHPQYRRQGIAGTLLNMIETRFKGLHLYAEAGSSEAKELYLKRAYQTITVFKKE